MISSGALRSLQIWTPDLAASCSFYCDIVGMEEVHRDTDVFAILQLGGFRLDRSGAVLVDARKLGQQLDRALREILERSDPLL